MKLLIKEQDKSYENAKIYDICNGKMKNKYLNDKKTVKLYHCHYLGEYRGAAHSIFTLKRSVPEKTSKAFHNGSNYDCQFIIKQLEEELEKNLLVQEKTLKPLHFQYKKKLLENMSCILKFIDNGRFMTSSLSSLVNNLYKGIHRIKC